MLSVGSFPRPLPTRIMRYLHLLAWAAVHVTFASAHYCVLGIYIHIRMHFAASGGWDLAFSLFR
jgi:hypothetical protein